MSHGNKLRATDLFFHNCDIFNHQIKVLSASLRGTLQVYPNLELKREERKNGWKKPEIYFSLSKTVVIYMQLSKVKTNGKLRQFTYWFPPPRSRISCRQNFTSKSLILTNQAKLMRISKNFSFEKFGSGA